MVEITPISIPTGERRPIVITCWYLGKRNGRADTTDADSGKRPITGIWFTHRELKCRATGIEGCHGKDRYWDPFPGHHAWADIRWDQNVRGKYPRAFNIRCAACEAREIAAKAETASTPSPTE